MSAPENISEKDDAVKRRQTRAVRAMKGRDTKIEWNGRNYWPVEFAVCMAFDAFRLCLFGHTKNFSKREVIAWIEASS